MPRYFFDTLEGGNRDCDPEGLDLTDERSARRMAWSCLAEVLADIRVPPDSPVIIFVSDHLRRPIYEVVAEGRGIPASTWPVDQRP